MGFRFRKSIKIAPGIRMNIGKKGVSSISAGMFNFGKRGIHQNINIPGTGLSYRTKIVGRSKADRSSHHKTTTQMEVDISLGDDGLIIFKTKQGFLLPDNLIPKAKRQNRPYIEEWLSINSELFNEEIQALLNIHLTTPAPRGEIIVNPKPNPPNIKKHGMASKVFDGYRKKTDKKNQLAKQKYDLELTKWNNAENSLRTDVEVMGVVLTNALSSLIWPRETLISFDIVDYGRKVLLDIDLPQIEDMPSKESKVNLNRLCLTIKNRTQKQMRLDYLAHVHAIGFRLIGDVFAYLPSVSQIVFSGYSQRTSKKTGNISNEYLYSVRVNRELWNKINFNNLATLDVVECFEQFETNRKVSKTGVIYAIEPFEQ